MFTLRPYQQEAVESALSFFQSDRKYNGLMVLPTGAGKSLVIADIVRRLNAPVLVFQPSKEILVQNLEKIRACGMDATIYSASLSSKHVSNLTLATIGSVKSNPALFERFRHVIIDECHGVNARGGMYKDFLDATAAPRTLGLTATPYRLTTDGFGGSILKFLTRTRPRIFDELIYYCQCRDMYDAGWWSPLKYYKVDGFDTSRLRMNSTGADYTDESVQQYYNEFGFSNRLLDVAGRLLTKPEEPRRGILVFTRFVAESEFLLQHIPEARMVTAETKPKERDALIRDFRSGKIRMVCNVGVLTTGFDYPELDTVLLARPTMSLALYYQMVGRAVRPHPAKKEAWIVDICGNLPQFGKVEDLHIANDGFAKWHVRSGDKRLTNVYLGAPRPIVNPIQRRQDEAEEKDEQESGD